MLSAPHHLYLQSYLLLLPISPALAISHLSNNPHLHDKVEFDVIPTCISHDFHRFVSEDNIVLSLNLKAAEWTALVDIIIGILY